VVEEEGGSYEVEFLFNDTTGELYALRTTEELLSHGSSTRAVLPCLCVTGVRGLSFLLNDTVLSGERERERERERESAPQNSIAQLSQEQGHL
jgi:hypothetical protein